MKKIGIVLGCLFVLTSCVNETQVNNPAFQAKFNDTEWKAKNFSVSIGINGGLVFTALRGNEQLVIETSSKNPGTYILGTSNQNNYASYTVINGPSLDEYATSIYPGPVFRTRKLTPGNNYVNSNSALATGGSGSGLVLKITVDNIGGVATDSIKARGTDYKAGDIITLEGGNNNATFSVMNVQQSNGEVVIESIDNNTFTGTFKINMVDGLGRVVTFSQGIFYKIPLQ